MKVADILAVKGSQVVTGNGDASVLDAATLLSDAHVGVLPIVDDEDRVIGTLSERDVVHGIGTRGRSFLDQRVSHAMSRRFLTCSRDDDVRGVMATITHERTRHLPVVDDHGVLVGIVSIGDVLKSLLDNRELEVKVLRDFYVAHH
jgi:CBS-domain-containing membrane protein